MSSLLADHESSMKHIRAIGAWIELENRLKEGKTIDKKTQKLMQKETQHWNNVLQRIISIVQFLAERNLLFRGTVDRLFQPNNGNFLGLVELLGKYDSCLEDHLRRIKSEEIRDHYLGKRIQNEVINLIGDAALKKIVNNVRNSKYYSIILDCTPDAGHQEQMTMILRICNIVSTPVEINEYFVGFMSVDDSTGLGLAEACLEKLEDLNLCFQNCRGQGYDNGANMKGCNRGVQKHLLELNPKSFYVLCGCHSLNLILGDMAKSSVVATTLFGVLHQIYVLFGASTQRWKILKTHVKNLTVKPISDTRWECRIDSVKAVRYQTAAVYDALVEVSENANDPKAKTEATGLAKQLKNFQFLVTLVIWYDLLFQMNMISKLMQSKDMQFDIALECIKSATEFMKKYKENGFVSAQISARELAQELEMEPDEIIFPAATSLRRRKVPKQFDYESIDESLTDAKEKYRVEFFNVLLDQAVTSLTARFEQMERHFGLFGFLHNIKKITEFDQNDLMKCCMDLNIALTDASGSDIDPKDLCNELQIFSNIVPDTVSSSLDALRFIYDHGLNNAVPNVVIALRIALTIPITVASGERSFSKLKLIKNYLRMTMTQERLNSLAMISIERDIVQSLDYSQFIADYAAIKARKVDFC